MNYVTIEIGSSNLSAWVMKKNHTVHLGVLTRNTKTFITEGGGIQLQFKDTSVNAFRETNPNFPGIKIIYGPPTAKIEHPCSTEDILPLKDLHIGHFLDEEWPREWWE